MEAKTYPPPAMVDRKCEWCKKPFQARKADVNRGWGRFCSKSCKAMKQEKRTHQNASFQHRRTYARDRDEGRPEEFADAHLFSNEDYFEGKDY
jgi:hypothetical protein